MNDTFHFLEVDSSEAQVNFDLWLFHEFNHINLQAESGWRTFVVKKKTDIVALVRFHCLNAFATGSLHSPFGTFQFSEDLPTETLYAFIQFCEQELFAGGIKRIELKNPPILYAPVQNTILNVVLLNLGYQIIEAEIGSLLTLDKSSARKIDSWEVRKLKQAKTAGLKFEQLTTEHLKRVYEFLHSCRDERGQSLSLSFEAINRIVEVFPDRFSIFTVQLDEKLVAASICIRINKTILYNFYSAHSKQFDHLSPVVFLIESLMAYCETNTIELLDLGTSALDGKPNFSLLDFKLRLGAVPSPKYTFEKKR